MPSDKLLGLLSSLVYFPANPSSMIWMFCAFLCIFSFLSFFVFPFPLWPYFLLPFGDDCYFLDPCLLSLSGITKTSSSPSLYKPIESRLWEKDPALRKPLFPRIIAGINHSGISLVPCQEVAVWMMCPPFSLYHLQRDLSRKNMMGLTNKLSGVSTSWVEWPVKTGLCQKWWMVFVDFEQVANRSATV